MKILVVEDDPFVADDLVDKLTGLEYRVTAVAESYELALEAVEREKPDLALLDIELKGNKTGIDLGKELSKKDIPFIYLTSIQDMSTYLKAKDTAPLRNLPKPVDTLNLRNALLELNFTESKSAESPVVTDPIMLIMTRDGIKLQINPDCITYLAAAGSYCEIYFEDGIKHVVVSSMKEVFEKLNHPKMVRISRSNCINLKYVVSVRGNEVEMPNKIQIPITESYKADFSRYLKQL